MNLDKIDIKIQISDFLKKFKLYNLYELNTNDENIFCSYEKNISDKTYTVLNTYVAETYYLYIGNKDENAYFLVYYPFYDIINFSGDLFIIKRYKYKNNMFVSKSGLSKIIFLDSSLTSRTVGAARYFNGQLNLYEDMNDFYQRLKLNNDVIKLNENGVTA